MTVNAMLPMVRPYYLDYQSGRSRLSERTVWTDSPNSLDMANIPGLIFN